MSTLSSPAMTTSATSAARARFSSGAPETVTTSGRTDAAVKKGASQSSAQERETTAMRRVDGP